MPVDFPALTEAQGALDAARKELAGVLEEAGSNYDLAQVKSVPGSNEDKLSWIQQKNEQINERKSKVTELQEVARIAQDAANGGGGGGHVEAGSEPGGEGEGRGRKSFGRQVVESKAVTQLQGRNGPVATVDVGLKTLFETGAGWDPEIIRTGRVEESATRPAPRVVEFLPQTTTSQAGVRYMEETTFTNNAAEAAEGTSYPEAALQLTERTSEVRKVAVFLPVTDEQFEDEPRAESYVNNRLPFMLQQRLDLQVLVGDGVAPNLEGTENVTGIQSQALGSDPIPDAIYKAARRIRDDGFAEPSAVFIRPSNWEAVRLLKTADGQYIWGHPSMPGPFTIWGLPVVETTAAPSAKAILGDYMNFAELAVRRGIDVQVSNSHSTYFVDGKLALRADVRVALIHYRPAAFAEVTGL